MAARLSDFLVQDGALPVETVRVAVARQIVYGGALDTALLEMDALAEATIWNELSHASGLPIPDPDLVSQASPAASAGFDVARAERCRAVPIGRRGERLQLLVGDPIEREALREASAELAMDLELYIVPEVRLKMAHQIVYGQPVPPRFVPLLGRVLGPDSARRWAAAHTSVTAGSDRRGPVTDVIAVAVTTPSVDQVDQVDEVDDLCQIAGNPHVPGRIAALHLLRDRLEDPRVRELVSSFRAIAVSASPERALGAIVGITELRDCLAVPLLIDLVDSKNGELADAARQALIEITRQDFGKRQRRWRSWMDAHGRESRADWLFAGLGHRMAEIRLAASEELWQITGEDFDYQYDAPKREREQARERWQTWWQAWWRGRQQTP